MVRNLHPIAFSPSSVLNDSVALLLRRDSLTFGEVKLTDHAGCRHLHQHASPMAKARHCGAGYEGVPLRITPAADVYRTTGTAVSDAVSPSKRNKSAVRSIIRPVV